MSTLVFENKYYSVIVLEGGQSYGVLNKDTRVIEAEYRQLPRAIIAANEYGDYLTKALEKPEVANAATVVPIR